MSYFDCTQYFLSGYKMICSKEDLCYVSTNKAWLDLKIIKSYIMHVDDWEILIFRMIETIESWNIRLFVDGKSILIANSV